MNYGEKIKEARTKKKFTQKQLAELIGVSNNLVCKWEIGDRTPKPEMLEKLIDILDVDERYFSAIKEELVPIQVFDHLDNGEMVYSYDVWNDKPVYKNVLANLINNEIFEENVTELNQDELDSKYFVYESRDNKTNIIKKDFKRIIDGRQYAIIDDDKLLFGQLFNYKNGEFFAIIIDQSRIVEQAVDSVKSGKDINSLDNDIIIRKFYKASEKDKIAGIVIATVIGLE